MHSPVHLKYCQVFQWELRIEVLLKRMPVVKDKQGCIRLLIFFESSDWDENIMFRNEKYWTEQFKVIYVIISS